MLESTNALQQRDQYKGIVASATSSSTCPRRPRSIAPEQIYSIYLEVKAEQMLAEPRERGALMAAFHIEGYLAFALPAIAAGHAVQRLGVLAMTNIFGATVILLAGTALILALVRLRQARRWIGLDDECEADSHRADGNARAMRTPPRWRGRTTRHNEPRSQPQRHLSVITPDA